MAILKKKYGAHLNAATQQALAACRTPMPPQVLLNPLTRDLAKRLIETDWSSTQAQIDFPYTIEDETISGVPCVRYRTANTSASAPLLIYLHAGAFVWGSPRVNAAAILPTCDLSGSEAIGVDYTVAPNAAYPTQLEQIEAVYRAVLETGRAPRDIVLVGDSAGGALALASLHRWRRQSLALPAGVALASPVVDAEARSDTYLTLRGHDPIFGGWGVGGLAAVYAMYAPGEDLSNPEISPLAGDYCGMPPMLIHVGAREVFLGDSARLAEKARRAGVDVSLRVHDGLFHLFHQHWALEDAKAVHADIAAFVRRITTAGEACAPISEAARA